MQRYPRDMLGHGASPPDPQWPGEAKIAVQFVVNYEEGGENNILHGDAASEAFLSEIVGAEPWLGKRHWNMESIYEYGARAGFWRLHRLFTEMEIPVTVYGVATALARSPVQVQAMLDADWEIASHGMKWIDYRDVPRDEERQDLERAIALHAEVTGARPRGWYTGRCSDNTVDLVAEAGGFDYCSDVYDDDLPYWHLSENAPLLMIPYTLDANDMRFASAQGFNSGDQFFTYLKDSFDALLLEGRGGAPKMMSVGLHCRLIGRPGRIMALRRFVEYARSHTDAWFPRRIDIAEHWARVHPAPRLKIRPSAMAKAAFIEEFAEIFEHSPRIAERAHDLELGPAHDSAIGVHGALVRIFRRASDSERLDVLRAHPDLAGKFAQAQRLTTASTNEQASAGLDALTDDERAAFSDLNSRYVTKFGFPFIIAVRDHDKSGILRAFQRRLDNTRETEFAEACRQVERIAMLRLLEKFAS